MSPFARDPFSGAEHPWVAAVALGCLLVLAIWLGLSLYWVGIDFDDGYSTIVNAQHLLGVSSNWVWSRGPLMAVLLIPAEWLSVHLQLQALDPRPHHLLFAVLHLAQAILCWKMFARVHGARPSTLIAWLAAIPTVAWASYAPFISHDIVPGLLLLAMLVLAGHYLERPNRVTWLALVALGFLAAGVKHMHAALWAAVLLGWVVASGLSPGRRTALRHWLGLGSAAVASAVLTVLAYGLSLDSTFPDLPLWQRPFAQVAAISSHWQQFGDPRDFIYQPVYARNLWAFGLLTVSLLLPGLWFAWRSGKPVLRAAAIAFLAIAVLLQALPFKETRYALVLAPLGGLLIVPAIDAVLAMRRAWLWPLLALLAVDLTFATREALRLRHPFYRDQVQSFLADLPPASDPRGAIVMTGFLSFVAPDSWAFFGDRYHRIVHLSRAQLGPMLGHPPSRFRLLEDLAALTRERFAADDYLIFVNAGVGREPPIAPDNRTTMPANFLQFVARAETVTLRREGAVYRLESSVADQRPWLLLRSERGYGDAALAWGEFSVVDVLRLEALEQGPSDLRTTGFRIFSLCDTTGCRRFDPPAADTP
jgi:hypothetical protein